MEAEAAQALVIEGISNCPHFTTGHKFKLERHFDAAGEYVIKSITPPCHQRRRLPLRRSRRVQLRKHLHLPPGPV